MKPEYLNALKAGIKTAFITFITTIIAASATLMDGIRSWTVDGNPPNMDTFQKLALAALLALLVGVGNAVIRFIQAAGVPFLGAIFDKTIGTAPTYIPPPESPVDALGPAKMSDRGESTIVVVVCVLACIALVIFILNNR